MRHFAEGLAEVIVLEEKDPYLELFVKDSLYPLADRPAVVGKARRPRASRSSPGTRGWTPTRWPARCTGGCRGI